jgi:hypothetical protein
MYKNKTNLFCLGLILVGVGFLVGCPKKPPVHPRPRYEFKLKQTGVDFSPVLVCIGSIESKTVAQKYDERRRITEYTEVFTCTSTGNSFDVKYSDFQYAGPKAHGYRAEMTCEVPPERHSVVYKDIEYNASGEVISYTAFLDGEEKIYMK